MNRNALKPLSYRNWHTCDVTLFQRLSGSDGCTDSGPVPEPITPQPTVTPPPTTPGTTPATTPETTTIIDPTTTSDNMVTIIPIHLTYRHWKT